MAEMILRSILTIKLRDDNNEIGKGGLNERISGI